MDYGTKKVSKSLHLGWTVFAAFLTFAYILEIFKGEMQLSIIFIIFAAILAPYMIGSFLIFRDKTKRITQYAVSVGYGITYVVILFITDNINVWVYIIPFLSLLVITNNQKLLLSIGIGGGIANVLQVIYHFTLKENSSMSTQTAEIQLACVFLSFTLAVVASRVSADISGRTLREVEEQKGKAELLYGNISIGTGKAYQLVEAISSEITTLQNNVDLTALEMEQVSKGAMQIAESVQEQLTSSQEIQKAAENTNEQTSKLAEYAKSTLDTTEQGIIRVKELNECSIKVQKAEQELQGISGELNVIAKSQSEIIEIILNIANQTNLLALNASIEAARAGEAGRGFSVVAGSINDLAMQTKKAIEDIGSKVNDLMEKSAGMTQSAETMGNITKQQLDYIREVTERFHTVANSIKEVNVSTEHVAINVKNINEGNKSLVEAISSLSAVSEEISASSQQTLALAESNKSVADNVTNAISDLHTNLQDIMKD